MAATYAVVDAGNIHNHVDADEAEAKKKCHEQGQTERKF